MRIGVVVNPDAGLGGKLGFKGSDGRALEARAAGAEDRAGPRMTHALNAFSTLLQGSLNRADSSITLVGWEGRMGGTWVSEQTDKLTFEPIGTTPDTTVDSDTHDLVRALIEA